MDPCRASTVIHIMAGNRFWCKAALPFSSHVCGLCHSRFAGFRVIYTFLTKAKGPSDAISHRDLNPPSPLQTLQGLWQCANCVSFFINGFFFMDSELCFWLLLKGNKERLVSHIHSQTSSCHGWLCGVQCIFAWLAVLFHFKCSPHGFF